jgi:hypothetical protein
MKFCTLAGSTLIAIAAFAQASLAQSSTAPSQHTMRGVQAGSVTRSMSAQVPATANVTAPTLHSAKPAPGMLPQMPSGPAGRFARDTTSQGHSSDLRSALNPQ